MNNNVCSNLWMYNKGVATGGYIGYIGYRPKISPSKLLWGKNDAKTVIEHEY